MASALQLYEQACSGYERVLGADHPDTLACRANLAHAYYTTGRLTDATALLRDTAARCERVLPRGDQLTRSVQESLAPNHRGRQTAGPMADPPRRAWPRTTAGGRPPAASTPLPG
jgi:hypothetical protein